MNSFSCEVLTIENNEEVHVGWINIFFPPRVGEYLWFSEERRRHTSWIVEDVAHHVGNGELGSCSTGYQSIVIYAKPTIPIEWEDDELPTQSEGSD